MKRDKIMSFHSNKNPPALGSSERIRTRLFLSTFASYHLKSSQRETADGQSQGLHITVGSYIFICLNF